MQKIDILNIGFSDIKNEEIENVLESLILSDKKTKIYTPNPEILMLADKDKDFKEVLNKGDIVLPDGIGIVIASKIKRAGIKERVTGIDTMEKVLNIANENHLSIFILGGKPDRAKKALSKIGNKYPNINLAGEHHGYFNNDEDIILKINKSKADILFVCLGAPKQEIWINNNLEKLENVKLAMGVGGAVDIYSDSLKRAPKFFQKVGLEWLYRMIQEPKRFKRILSLPKFIWSILTN